MCITVTEKDLRELHIRSIDIQRRVVVTDKGNIRQED